MLCLCQDFSSASDFLFSLDIILAAYNLPLLLKSRFIFPRFNFQFLFIVYLRVFAHINVHVWFGALFMCMYMYLLGMNVHVWVGALFMCMYMCLPVWMCMYELCLWRLKRMLDFSRAGVTGGCGSPCGYWELKPRSQPPRQLLGVPTLRRLLFLLSENRYVLSRLLKEV